MVTFLAADVGFVPVLRRVFHKLGSQLVGSLIVTSFTDKLKMPGRHQIEYKLENNC